MSILDKTLGLLGYTKKSSNELTWEQVLSRVSYDGLGKLKNQRAQLEAYVDWVYAVAARVSQEAALIDLRAYANRSRTSSKKIARRLANHPLEARKLMLQRSADGKPLLEELEGHPLLDLFDNPNPVQDGEHFQEMLYLHAQLAGEALVGIIRNGLGKPAQLWPLMPYNMKHVLADDKTISHWVYRVGAEEIIWDANDVLHVPLTNPNNLYRGMSIVQAAARAIDTDEKSADWNRKLFKNGARPDVVLETDQILGQEVLDRLRDQWNDNYQGVDNAHKLAVLEKGLKAHVLTMSQRDMDFLQSRKFNRDQILAMWGTSRTILGIIEGDGRNNMETAEYSHAKRVIRPLMSRMVSAINHRLAPQYDTKLVIGFTDPVPDDKEFVLKDRMQRVNRTHTINEIRAEMGDDPIEGGDVLYLGAAVPLGQEKPATASDSEENKAAPLGGKKKASTALTTSAKR